MKLKKGLIVSLMVLLISIVGFGTSAFAATIGQELKSKEAGWERYDDTNQKIAYIGKWSVTNYYKFFNSTTTGTIDQNAKIKIKFKGSKIRILSNVSSTLRTDYYIKIDSNVDVFSEAYPLDDYTTLVYEKTGFENTVHSVEIYPKGTFTNTVGLTLDAIDIDDTGTLLDVNTPINLTANSENKTIELNWDAVNGATSYNVKRSTTAGGPYTTIASNVTGTSYTDSDVTSGTTYYYIVTAITSTGESANSNEASANLETPVVTGNNAILEITMTDGTIKEYDMTGTELDSFLKWYDDRSN